MKLDELIQSPDIPSLPEAVIRLTELINAEASVPEITAVISTEPALTIRTLELANSAWYKRERTILKVSDAISMIGMSALYQLIFSTSVTRIFHGIDTNLIDMMTFWKRSARMATLSQTLSSQLNLGTPIEFFTSGLVAHIGQLVLLTHAPNIAREILDKSVNSELPQSRVEMEILGYDHGEISAELLNKWKLPENLSEPIRYYTRPEFAPEQHQVASAILNTACHMQQTHTQDDSAKTDLYKSTAPTSNQTMSLIKLEEPMLPELAQMADELYESTLSILGIKPA